MHLVRSYKNTITDQSFFIHWEHNHNNITPAHFKHAKTKHNFRYK